MGRNTHPGISKKEYNELDSIKQVGARLLREDHPDALWTPAIIRRNK